MTSKAIISKVKMFPAIFIVVGLPYLVNAFLSTLPKTKKYFLVSLRAYSKLLSSSIFRIDVAVLEITTS